MPSGFRNMTWSSSFNVFISTAPRALRLVTICERSSGSTLNQFISASSKTPVSVSSFFAIAFQPSSRTLQDRANPAIFGLDIVVVKNGTDNLAQAVAFFSQVRQRPGARKGLLRLRL